MRFFLYKGKMGQGTDHLIFDGGGAQIKEKYRAYPELMNKISSTVSL
jgi:hypothetical protein